MDQPRISLKPNILLVPLDWGLGHATRCIPIIRQLLLQQANVVLAGEGATQTLLQKEFPQLPFVPLKGYRITYSKNRWTLPFVIATQVPKILSLIKYENIRLQEIVKEHAIDGIISDNRYGLYHQDLPSVFMTHQLQIKTGFGKRADRYLQELNYHYIERFSECWVPDNCNTPWLAGALSHPAKDPSIPVKYIGPLSRFGSAEEQLTRHVLIVLSGPEPQRTILEALVLKQLATYKQNVVLVRGLPGEITLPGVPAHVSVFNHLGSEALFEKMQEASFVISRCGYSTVMDLALAKKKSILIPTPGQTEQEYLSAHLQSINFALCIEQEKFRLKNALELAASFRYRFLDPGHPERLPVVVGDFLGRVRASKPKT